jgi:apocytochrome f
VYNTAAAGKVVSIAPGQKKGSTVVTVQKADGESVENLIPAGPEILVKEGQMVVADEPLTNNPNVGGFGQKDVEVILQNPARIQGLLAFFGTVLGAQVLLVLKKKQFEKVQLAEMNF